MKINHPANLFVKHFKSLSHVEMLLFQVIFPKLRSTIHFAEGPIPFYELEKMMEMFKLRADQRVFVEECINSMESAIFDHRAQEMKKMESNSRGRGKRL